MVNGLLDVIFSVGKNIMSFYNPFTIKLGYDNLSSFRRELMNYARSRHQMIARALELGIILDMPNRPEGELRRDPIAAQEYRSPCDEYRECRRVMGA
jgi:hypothetical protein